MIGGLLTGIAASPWVRAALRYGAIILAVVLFVLALLRSGEREKRAERHISKYGAAKADCEPCEVKDRWYPVGVPRRVLRSEDEGATQMARDIAETDDYKISCKLRKNVEMLFANLTRILGLDRLRLRSPAAQVMNSSSPPLPRISENSQASSRCRAEPSRHERQPLFNAHFQFTAI